MKLNIPLFKISTTKKDIDFTKNILKSGNSWAVGESIKIFENELKKLHNSKYAIVFNSGTSALISMFMASDLKNAEIIVPSFSFISTASSVILSGNKIKFCDIEEDTYGLSYESLKKLVTKQTAGVVIMHYSGSPARDTIKIKNFCKKKNILFFEDNAHSYGAKINKQITGMFGQSSAISFCQNKLITTGEGGAVITNDHKIYKKLLLIRSHGRVENINDDYFLNDKSFDYIMLGYNFRMPTMNAALGLSQLKNSYKLNIQKRIKNANLMNSYLSKNKNIKVPKKFKNHDHFYQQYTIRLLNNAANQRDDLKNYLNKKGISCRVYYEPIHTKAYYKRISKLRIKLPVTEKISNTILTLPMYPDLKKSEIIRISQTILEFLK